MRVIHWRRQLVSSVSTLPRQEEIRSLPCEYWGWKVTRQVAAMSEKYVIFPKINVYQSTEAYEQKGCRFVCQTYPVHYTDKDYRDGDMPELSAAWHFRLWSLRDAVPQRLLRMDEVCVKPFSENIMTCGDMGGKSCHRVIGCFLCGHLKISIVKWLIVQIINIYQFVFLKGIYLCFMI